MGTSKQRCRCSKCTKIVILNPCRKLVRLLLRYGANPDALNAREQTAAQCAEAVNFFEVAHYLGQHETGRSVVSKVMAERLSTSGGQTITSLDLSNLGV